MSPPQVSGSTEKTGIASSVVTGEYVSDHCAVLCKLQIKKPKEHWSEVKYRHADRVKLYLSSLRSILDQHAPVQKKLLPIRPHSPWYTDEITQAKKERRRCEKQLRASGLTVHYQIYIKQRNLVK